MHFCQITIAMQDDIAASQQCGCGFLYVSSLQCLHRQIIAHQQAKEAQLLANNIAQHNARQCCRMFGIESLVNHMGGHCHGTIGKTGKGFEINTFKCGTVN